MRRQPIGAGTLLAIAALDQFAITLSQQGLAVLSVAFKTYSHLGVAEMGVLFSTVAIGALLGMLPAGLALDHVGPRRVAWGSGAATLFLLVLLAVLLPRNFLALVALLGAVGFVLPALSLAGTTAVSARFEGSPQEGLAIAIRQSATPLGGILAASLFPFLVGRWSLPPVLLLIGVNAGGWTMALGGVLPAAPPRATRPGVPATVSLPAQVKGLGTLLRRLHRPLLISVLLAPGQYALLTYSLLDLHSAWHLGDTTAGLILAVALLAGFLQRMAMGRLHDRGHDTRRLIAATAAAAVIALAVWIWLPQRAPLAVIVLVFFAMGAGLDGWNALLTTWVTRETDVTERGLALGLTGMAGFVGIALLLPLFGLAIRLFQSYRPAWGLLAGVYLCAVILLLRHARRTPEATTPRGPPQG